MYIDWNTKPIWRIQGDSIIITFNSTDNPREFRYFYLFFNDDDNLKLIRYESDDLQVFTRQ